MNEPLPVCNAAGEKRDDDLGRSGLRDKTRGFIFRFAIYQCRFGNGDGQPKQKANIGPDRLLRSQDGHVEVGFRVRSAVKERQTWHDYQELRRE